MLAKASYAAEAALRPNPTNAKDRKSLKHFLTPRSAQKTMKVDRSSKAGPSITMSFWHNQRTVLMGLRGKLGGKLIAMIMNSVRPGSLGLLVVETRLIRNGGVIMRCLSAAQQELLSKVLEERLPEVRTRVPHKWLPRLIA